MFPVFLALCFVLKIFRCSEHYAPKFIESHYGTSTKNTLRALERTVLKIERRKADIEFLRFCLIDQLSPKFTRFKLYNQNRQSLAQVRTLRKKLQVAEYKILMILNLILKITKRVSVPC